MLVIFESLDIATLFTFFFKKKIPFKKKIFFFYKTKTSFIIKILLTLTNNKFIKINFNYEDIKDSNNLNYFDKIAANELIEFKNILLKNKSFKDKYLNQYPNLKNFVVKGIVYQEFARNRDSPARLLFIYKVIELIFKKKDINTQNIILIINKREWFATYLKFAKLHKIEIINNYFSYHLIKKNILIFGFQIKNIFLNIFKLLLSNKINAKGTHKIFINGRGQISFLPHYHSDLFWYVKSKINPNNILYDTNIKKAHLLLINNKINSSLNYLKKKNLLYKFSNLPIKFLNNEIYKTEVNFQILDYKNTYDKWLNFMIKNNIKIIFDWFKFNNHNFAIYDAIKKNNGISIFYQVVFAGKIDLSQKFITDINLSHCNFSYTIDKKNKSNFHLNLITGHLKKDNIELINYKSQKLKDKLISNGAKKIICLFDEGSLDSRWMGGNGHDFFRENYSKTLQEILNNRDLGLIIKPKKSFNFVKKTLGPVFELYLEAIKTKRVIFLANKESETYLNYHPLYAALASDLAIHSHLIAGTAGIESALEQIPTILINRENDSSNKLCELPKNKIVFENWDDALEASNEFLFKKNNTNEFGNWSKYIGEFDPFMDNNGALRIKEVIENSLNLFDRKYSSKEIILKISEEYSTKYGKDKVIKNFNF